MKGKNNPITFLTPTSNLGESVRYVKDRRNICLTVDQAKYSYKNGEQDSIANVEKIKQEIEDDRLDKANNKEEEENPYQKIIIN